jgi:hypothetical protein
MKKIHILFIALFLSASLNHLQAQKCKVTKDPISGEKVVSAGNGSIYFEAKGGKIKYDLGLQFSEQLTNVIEKGTEVIIKLVSGEIIKLYTATESKPSQQVYATQYSAGIITFYSLSFELEKQIVNQLSKAKIELIRFPDAKGKTIDVLGNSRYGKRYVKATMKGALFVLKNI